MQRARYYFLTCAVFARDQDIRIGRSDPRDGFEDGLHERGRGDELGTSLSLQQAILGGKAVGALQGAAKVNLRAQDCDQPFVLPWFLNEIPCPAAHCLHCQFNVCPSSHDNDGNRVVESNNLRKKVEALLPGSGISRVVQVNEQCIVRPGGKGVANKSRRSRGLHFVPLGA